ncbi:unnamed protein product [Sympodiomycopsis kandeliae]
MAPASHSPSSPRFRRPSLSRSPRTSSANIHSHQTIRKRPANHRRRASQPASLAYSSARQNHDLAPSPILSDGSSFHETSSDETDATSVISSDEEDRIMRQKLLDWDRKGKGKETSLEYLDLSLSVPFAVVTMRNNLLSYMTSLENKARAIAQRLRNSQENYPTESPVSLASSSKESLDLAIASADESFLAPFYAQLEAIREDLRRLTSIFPASAAHGSAHSLIEAAQSRSFSVEWNRLSAAVHLRLPSRPDFATLAAAADSAKLVPRAPELPSLLLRPSLPALPDVAPLLAKVQARFEGLHETVTALTLRDCWEEGKRQWTANATQRLRKRSPSAASLPSWDSIVSSVRESSEIGRVRAGEMVHSVIEVEQAMYRRACELANQGSQLIHYTDLPMLWKNNEYILSGYRFIPLENWSALLKSAFELHNETINIHSHLAGVIIVLPLFWPSKGLDDQTTWADRFVQTIYLVAALKCLVSSVVWHVFAGCSNAKWFERAACVDYSGVALLVAASLWTTIYNEFYCQPNIAMLYSLTTLVTGIVGAVVPWAPWFNQRENKGLRISVFLGMCFTGLLPFVHASYEHGMMKTLRFLSPIIPSVMCYIIGLILYATNFPERYWPGSFDIFGHAHQFWHISIVLAILLHYRAALQFHANRFEFSCAAGSHLDAVAQSAGTLTSAIAQEVSLGLSAMGLSSGAHGVEALNRADETIHGWRIVLGRLGGGAVGRWWNAGVEILERW